MASRSYDDDSVCCLQAKDPAEGFEMTGVQAEKELFEVIEDDPTGDVFSAKKGYIYLKGHNGKHAVNCCWRLSLISDPSHL